ncbi:SET domain-containing protein-lysine N-methyltransferase [Salmonella enterica subsp. salamae]|uniref:SET domain-containing protein-lysine N-methyltransferase n=1 Tax=Salmonella enterica subsp. salamae TaxID=59202 RepID=A0A6C8Y4I9_SALER|nr:SET domain-containing protein-lysine N-methyltransferase [Salmonella enterica subsp. salamae]EDT2641019.1 SET domain-containing protein-lysine N-methyltransferase [Salmonella enterica subsp. enterica serovar Abony]EDU9699898.1 SET domain-containing protein-lysine N-methyltransferase [Salmonella enterica subsp. salamae]MII77704.1 SET domain-containing protein-lysine N-methyltransferase [Salmonella enterica subsp. salamae]
MRGIGAVIHFHSPTGSSVPSPDFSGMWNSIRDWFSLPAQDEAAECFRVFYQPPEGTSSPDRLKYFLKLKTLASPGWQANFTAERILGTGETICMIASGKNSDFPPVTLHLSDQEWHSIRHQKEAVDSPLSSENDDSHAATVTETEERDEAPLKGFPITRAQIKAWRDLSPEAKHEIGGWKAWAQAQGIAISSAKNYLSNTGLKLRGIVRLQPPGERGAPITNTQIQTWLSLSQEAKRESGGWIKWAQAQGIAIGSASACLTNTGLSPSGAERLQPLGKKGDPITLAQLLAWFNMSSEERRASGGWATWAQTQGISYRSARKYLAPTDSETPPCGISRSPPSTTVTSASPPASASAGDEIAVSVSPAPASSGEKRSLSLATEDISAPPAKQIKEEEDPVTWRTHQINNNLPILQHWRDPTISVMAQAEGRIESLQVTRWGPLFNGLPRQTRARINQDIHWFLHNEGNHDARMNAMMSVSIPLDDSDGYRGRTIYAKTDLTAFTVLGPYSGRLLDSEKTRREYEKEYGKEASNYYFATRSQERLVSAWPQGNLLSLINSPVFTRRTAEAEARQNVSVVLVGKNINFFLTTRTISAGEELWFDYGPDYQHFEPGEALRSTQIKEESPSPKPGLI